MVNKDEYNIIETLQNYFTRKLLLDNLSSEVMRYFCTQWRVLCELTGTYIHHVSGHSHGRECVFTIPLFPAPTQSIPTPSDSHS